MTLVPELRAELLRAAQEQIHASTTTEPARRPKRFRQIGLPLVCAALLAGTGVATAAGLVVSSALKERSQAMTEEPHSTSPGPSADIGHDLALLAKGVEAEIPYPPNMDDKYDWSAYPAGPTLGTGRESRREVRIVAEARAACMWRIYFLTAHDSGRVQDAADAVGILRQIPAWPSMRSPNGVPDAHLAALAESAARGDTEPVRQDVRVNCALGQ